MPLIKPTVNQITQRMISDMEGRLTGNTSLLPVELLRVLIIVFAFAIHVLYGVLARLSINILPGTTNEEWATRHYKTWGVKRNAATYATGIVQFTGPVPATPIPIGTRMHRDDNSGVEYETTTAGSIGDITPGIVNVNVKSVDASEESNYDFEHFPAPLLLYLVSPIDDIDDTIFVVGELTGGNDIETIDSANKKLMQRVQQPGTGGSVADYLRWALSYPGVDNAWIYPNNLGAGSCVVVISPSNVVLAGEVETFIRIVQPVVANVIDYYPQFVFPFTAVTMEYDIKIDENTTEIQGRINQAIIDMFAEDIKPGGVVLISHTRTAISSSGVFDYEIDVIKKAGISKPIDDVDLDGFELPQLLIINFSQL